MFNALTSTTRVLNYGNPVNRLAPLNRSLISWWLALPKLSGGRRFVDLCGRHHGTFTGSSRFEGKRGRLSGNRSYYTVAAGSINCGDMSETESQSALTWSLWLRPGVLIITGSMLAKFNASTATERSWFLESGTVNSRVLMAISTNTTDGNTYGETASGILTAGAWTHIIVVFDGSQATNATRLVMYINGVTNTLSFTGTIPATTQATTSNVTVGQSSDGIRQYDAWFDDIRIYQRALSANDAMQLYNASRTGYHRELNWLRRTWDGTASTLSRRFPSIIMAPWQVPRAFLE